MPAAVCVQPVPQQLRETQHSVVFLLPVFASGHRSSSPLQPSPGKEPGSERPFSKRRARHLPWLCLDSNGKQNPKRGFISSHCGVGVLGELRLSSGAHRGLQCPLSIQLLEGPTSPVDPELYLPALCLSQRSQDIRVATGTRV